MDNDRARNMVNIVAAFVLIGLGILFLVGQVFRVRWGIWLWPFTVILPGLAFFVGMLLAGPKGAGLAIPGSIVTTVGLILLYQNTFQHWESWAYAWALIFPTAVGMGLLIEGVYGGHPENVRTGRTMLAIGIIVFVVAGAAFELLIFGGRGLGRYVWPLLLIGGGLFLLLGRGLFPVSRRESQSTSPFETPKPGKED